MPTTKNVGKLVEDGYDAIYHLYHKRRTERFWSVVPDIDAFTNHLPAGGSILDVGCGSGYIASLLEKRGFVVTGIDVSSKMLEFARKNAPRSTFIKMDMRKLLFPRESFDAVASFYSIIHVPRRYHLGILKSFHRVLKPNGVLAIHMGWGDWVGVEENWLGGGSPMYWSHWGKGKNVALIQKAKFKVVASKASRQKDGTHLFVLAQKS